MNMPALGRHNFAYIGLLAGAFVIALAAGWTPLGRWMDNFVYDWITSVHRPNPWPTDSIVLAIDEHSLQAFGGRVGLRKALADGLEQIAAASPKAVAVDAILADEADRDSDDRLEAALRKTHNLVLPSDLLADDTGWEDPLPRFKRWAAAVGHVHLDPDLDGVGRELALEKAFAHDRRWALALEAFRVSRNAAIVETPDDLEVGGVTIPASNASGRILRIRYRPPDSPIPVVSLKQLHDAPQNARQFAGKVVFAGVTAQTETKDRWITPYYTFPLAGVKVQANAYETIAHQQFLTSARESTVVLFCLLLVMASGMTYAWLWGWPANILAFGILAVAHVAPYAAFTRGTVFPFSPGVSTAWLSLAAAVFWQLFYVRRRLVKSESERDRYQHAMQFVTHEMRTPLTAIQGSSELMSRYAMPEEKRKQVAQLIHSESKRLGRMIQIFLDVERLSAGEVELKKEILPVREIMAACVERALPLAERKQIRITMDQLSDEVLLTGDRELMEYAFYNLLTNAIKYSPAKTEVTVTGGRNGDHSTISVRDQGIGIDRKEVRKIFQKFYRTKKAEQSGEAGTGIGLSIVEQIILRHGGRIDVESALGKGSCFTLTLPVAHGVPARPLAAN
jgi:signal transduction histidine kinase